MISTRLNVNHENKQPPLIIPSEYKLSATKFAAGLAIFWLMLYGFTIFTSLDLERYPISAFQVVAWIIAGLAVGTISSAMFTLNQLGRLSKYYQFSTNGKDIVLFIVPTVLFFIFGFFGGRSIGIGVQGFLISGYAWGLSLQITRIVMLLAFERKENMRLMQSWWGPNIFLMPKAPNINVNRSDAATKKELSNLTVRS